MRMLESLVGLRSCPYCGVNKPGTVIVGTNFFVPLIGDDKHGHAWVNYKCTSCNNVLLARGEQSISISQSSEVNMVVPYVEEVNKNIPPRALKYLEQAIAAIHAPDGSAMLAGSAVDAMLKAIGLTEGNVFSRIDEAVRIGKLTMGMSEWAHEVRLGSNNPRHADIEEPHTTVEQARQSVEFAKMLGHFMFVLPAMVAARKVVSD